MRTARPARGLGGGDDIAAGPVRIRGRILDAEQRAVHEARIRLVRADGGVDPRSAESGIDGSFEFEGLDAGVWWLSVHGVGSLPIRSRIEVAADTDLTISLIDQPATYEPSPLELMPPEEPVPPPAFVAPTDELRAAGASSSGS